MGVVGVGYYGERLDFLPLHILEVKSASPELPGFLHNEFKAAGIEQSTFSKYHFAVNLLLSLHQSEGSHGGNGFLGRFV